MFTKHYDHQQNHWNVFDAQGFYVCSFLTVKDADDFLRSANGAKESK